MASESRRGAGAPGMVLIPPGVWLLSSLYRTPALRGEDLAGILLRLDFAHSDGLGPKKGQLSASTCL